MGAVGLKSLFCIISVLATYIAISQTPLFSTPSKVCTGEPLEMRDIFSGGTTYKWNFCSPRIARPLVENVSNAAGLLNGPAYMDYAFFNNTYYAFITNFGSGDIIRLDFGNSLLNLPTAVNLGNFGNTLPADGGTGGIQVVQNEGNWYAIIVSGYPPGGASPKIVKLSFGTNLNNVNPIATDWGNIGNMYDPMDLVVLEENNQWYGFTVNAETNSITRFSFSSSFENFPSATNLGNIGGLVYPTGIAVVRNNNATSFYITNGGDITKIDGNYSLTRLDFVNGLGGTPNGTNIGNAGHSLQHARDMSFLEYCNNIHALSINAHPFYNNLLDLNFESGYNTFPSGTFISAQDVFNFPYSITPFNNDNGGPVAFVLNNGSNSISRITFPECNSANPNSSADRIPPPISYSTPGTYTISLTIDEGLPSEATFCQDVIVESCSGQVLLTADTTVCSGAGITLQTNPAISYKWSPSLYLDDPEIANPVATPLQTTKYYVEATIADNTILLDSITITVKPSPAISLSDDTIICQGTPIPLHASGGERYMWTPSSGLSDNMIADPFAAPDNDIVYKVKVTGSNNCVTEDSVRISVRNYPSFKAHGDLSLCEGEAAILSATGGDTYAWMPAAIIDDPSASTTSALPRTNTVFSVVVRDSVCNYDTTIYLPVEIRKKPVVTATTSNDINCTTPTAQLLATGAAKYTWTPARGLNNPSISNPIVYTDTNTTYKVVGIDDFGCSSAAFVTVKSDRTGVPSFLVPNAFTPDGDGKNDCFGIQRWGNATVHTFTIYNRFGKALFRTSNERECWDGTLNGQPQPAGSYVYLIEADTFCGPVKRRGMITLIR